MSYTILKTDGSALTSVVDGTIDQLSTDLTLIGKNFSGFGAFINDNFVRLLENFSNTVEPSNPITGQLWFDTTENRLKVYDGNVFKVSGGTIVSNTIPSSISAGDIWIDSGRQQLFFNDGYSTKLAGPTYTATQGVTGFVSEDVVDTVGVSHTLLMLYVAQSLIGIYSKDSFVPTTPIAGFSGTINIGFNVSTLSGVKMHTPVTQADYLIAADGTFRTAANFVSTTDNSSTTGTISIQNAIPLVLGQGSSTEINATTSIFQIKSNTANQNYGINLLSGTGLTTAFFINATTQRTGIYTSTPEATLDVNGGTIIRGNLQVLGDLTTISTTNIEISDKLITLGVTEEPTNLTADGGGISLAGGIDGDKTIAWSNNTSSWTSSEHLDLAIGKTYKINSIEVLSQNSLGSSINFAPGLQSVGTLDGVNVSSLKIGGSGYEASIAFVGGALSGNITLIPKGSGTVDVSSAKISNVGAPADYFDAANKNYVDTTVRTAPLGLTVSIPVGYTNAQIAANYITKIYPPGDHENGTKCRVVVTEGGADTFRQYQILAGTWSFETLL